MVYHIILILSLNVYNSHDIPTFFSRWEYGLGKYKVISGLTRNLLIGIGIVVLGRQASHNIRIVAGGEIRGIRCGTTIRFGVVAAAADVAAAVAVAAAQLLLTGGSLLNAI